MIDFLGNTLIEEQEIFEEVMTLCSNYESENALERLTIALEKLELKYTLIPLESNDLTCTVILHIDCSPSLSVHESGSTYTEACNNLAIKALQFLHILYRRRNARQETTDDKGDFESLISCKKKSK